jgi:hypothetical protein
MNGIDPRIGAWFNFVVLILGAIGAGTVILAGVPDAATALIKTWALNGVVILSAANLVFHLYDAPSAVPKGISRMTSPPQDS